MTGSQICWNSPSIITQRVCSMCSQHTGCTSQKPKKDSRQSRKDNYMDINTMLSAAFDAYEKTKMELIAAQETIKELKDENEALKEKVTALKDASSASVGGESSESGGGSA